MIFDNSNYIANKIHGLDNHSELEMAEFILSENCSDKTINGILANKQSPTLLHLACLNNKIKIVEALIKRKAKVNLTTKDAMPALHLTILYGQYSTNEDKEKNIKVINSLINANADINLKHMYTPFITACMVEKNEVIALLLNKGARIQDVDSAGNNGMFYLKDKGNIAGLNIIESFLLAQSLQKELPNENVDIIKKLKCKL